jgi:RNA polymerase sigma-70 factor (ECF subfamily)
MVKQMLKVISGRDEQQTGALTDDDLMRLVALNRKDAFETLVARHQALVFGLATRYLGDRQAGRDVTQDVFLSIWAGRDKYRPIGKFLSYLTSVCINRCRVVARGRRNLLRKVASFGQEASTASSPGDEVPLDALLDMERRKEIQHHLTRLPEKTRLVMIYRFVHDMSLGDISEVTGMPIGTVKSHIARGTKRIRKMIARGG